MLEVTHSGGGSVLCGNQEAVREEAVWLPKSPAAF